MTVRLVPSSAQRSMWFGARLDGGGAAYNVGEFTEIHGAVDPGLLLAAVRQVVAATETLRSRFVEDADGVGLLVEPELRCSMPVVEVAGIEGAREWMARDFAVPFDLEQGPLFRYALLRAGDGHWVWYQAYHHIAVDGFSCSLIAGRVAAAYTALGEAGVSAEGVVEGGAKGVVKGEAEGVVKGEAEGVVKGGAGDVVVAAVPDAPLGPLLAADDAYDAEGDRAYWNRVLADRPEAVSLSSRPPRVSGRFLRRTSHVTGELVHSAADLTGTRWSRVVLAASAAYLHAMTGAEEIVLGLAVTARTSPAELATPGMASNVLPLRITVRPDALAADLVRETALATRELLAHQRYRGEELCRELNWPEGGRRFFGPVVNIMAFGPELRFGSLPTTRHNLSTGPVEDLAVNVYDRADGNGVRVDFDAGTEQYPDTELTAHHDRFVHFLERFAEAVRTPGALVGRIAITSPSEESTLAGAPASGGGGSVPEVFAARVAATPDAEAVVHGDLSLSYAELDRRSNRLAHRLLRLGVRPEDRVTVLVRRSGDLIVALLAVLKAGGAYVGLDASAPRARTLHILEETGARLLLTDTDVALRDGLRVVVTGDPSLLDESDRRPDVRVMGRQLCYVSNTSGSTGTPKGVAVTHHDVVSLARDSAFAGGAHARVLVHSPVAFDASTYEMWVPLLGGGTAVVAEDGPTVDAFTVRQLTERHGLTGIWLTAGLFRLAAEEDPGCFAGLREVWAGGEAVPSGAVRRVLEACPGVTVTNGYGPTETTTFATNRPCVDGSSVPESLPVGRPLDGVRAYVLDSALRPVPRGIVGELYLSGDGVVRGYLGRAGATAERFVADPFGPAGSRMYRTGDRVRVTDANELEFHGRSDSQVKLRGFRIEPAEVEAVLAGHPGVAQAVVVVRGELLVGYAVSPLGARELRAYLADRLPEYLVPAVVVPLERLPLTTNGKVDLRALPEPVLSTGPRRAARSPLEETLCGLFADVLDVPEVAADDSFFALGGHSLLALRLVGRVRGALGVTLALRDVFTAPTPARLAERVSGAAAPTASRPIRRGGATEVPLSSAQRRLWFLDRLEGAGAAYHVPLAVRLVGGGVDVGVLEEALGDVVGRHEVLRTVYPAGGGVPCQRVVGVGRARVRVGVEVVGGVAEPLGQWATSGGAGAGTGTGVGVVAEPLGHRATLPEVGAVDQPLGHQTTPPRDGAVDQPLDHWAISAGAETGAGAEAGAVAEPLGHQATQPRAGAVDQPLGQWASSAGARAAAGASTGSAAQPISHSATLSARLSALAAREFRLAEELPIRAHLLVVGPEEHVLLLVLHHIAADGQSLGPLARDLADAYEARAAGRVPGWAPLAVQYGDFAVWQAELLGDPQVVGPQVEYWTRTLAGMPDELVLPADRARPARASHLGGDAAVRFGAELHRRIRKLAGETGTTPFMVVQAALAALLTRLGAGTDIPIGTPVAGRPDEVLDDMVGCFLNTLVLRTDTSGDPGFRELLARVRETDLAAHAHQDLPFEQVVEALAPPRSLARHPLFQVMLAFRPSEPELRLPGLTATQIPVETGATKVDLTFNLGELRALDGSPDGIEGFLQYSADLFDRGTAEGIVVRLERLLWAAVDAPDLPIGALEILGSDERRGIVEEFNDTARDIPATTFPHMFEEQAARRPEAVAVTDVGRVLTYRQLSTASDDLARALIGSGARPGRVVAFSLPRSADVAVAVLAVLKSGAAYLPLDPDHPADRTAYLLADADPVCVISRDRLDVDCPVVSPEATAHKGELPDLHPADAAYLIYTSGTTGRPKGVVVEHRNLTNYVARCVEEYPSLKGTSLLHATMSFDATVTTLHGALAAGGQVHIAAVHEADERQLTFLKATPSHLALLPALPHDISPAEEFMLGGEALVGEALRAWRREHPDVRLINHYGPTELTVGCTDHRIEPGDELPSGPVPVGRPMWNTRAYVLDRRLNPVPAGVEGELYVGGAQVARGYHNRPALTGERFVADPYGPPGSRMYRTGDLAVQRADGTLELRGRSDGQLKIRGLRIEPGEIEGVLASYDGVEQAAVVVREDRPGVRRLVGYLVGAAGVDPADVRTHAARRLPEHLVPEAFVVLDALPMTVNGKLDRDALPAPVAESGGDRAARTPAERVLRELFVEVLGREVGLDDGFFDLGGDSIASIHLVSRALAAGLRLSPRDVFEHRTVAALAAVADSRPTASRGPVQEPATGGVPLTPAMHRLRERGGPIGQFSQSVVLVTPVGADEHSLTAALQAVVDHHAALRMRVGADWSADIPAPGTASAGVRRVTDRAELKADQLDSERGELVRAVWYDAGPDRQGRLLLTVHHLAVDGVSWGILRTDLAAAWRGEQLPPTGTPFRQWARLLEEEAQKRRPELEVWRHLLDAPTPDDRSCDPARDVVGTVRHLTRTLPTGPSAELLTTVPAAFHAGPDDVLLTALALAFARRGGRPALLVDVERHGREDLFEDVDLSRTVGWFTSVVPARLDLAGVELADAAGALRAVKEQVRAVADHGIGYGMLRHLDPVSGAELAQLAVPQVGFNYLGRTSRERPTDDWASVPDELPGELAFGAAHDPQLPLAHGLEVTVVADDDGLRAVWSWAPGVWSEAEVGALADLWCTALDELSRTGSAGGHTPSDLPLVSLSQAEIDELEAEFGSEWR
ncbi:amino acid adenylation domain-containing protein [Streptomyces sp. 4F14]|uniref:amino acid adenylation domain-containing protein n=1 Tax=Streptomyces sp. 4F14 TaxID=3394380 RepID=UPI003A884469